MNNNNEKKAELFLEKGKEMAKKSNFEQVISVFLSIYYDSGAKIFPKKQYTKRFLRMFLMDGIL